MTTCFLFSFINSEKEAKGNTEQNASTGAFGRESSQAFFRDYQQHGSQLYHLYEAMCCLLD